MEHDVSKKQLRSCSFRGQDLSGESFKDADIRGINFSGTTLSHANFSNAKAGLTPVWEFSLKSGLILSVIMLSFVGGYAGDLAGSLLPDIESLAGKIFYCTAGLCLIFSFPIIIIRKGLSVGFLLFLVLTPIFLTFAAALGFSKPLSGLLLLFIGLTIGMAVMVAGAIAVAVAQILPGNKIWIVIISAALIAATLGVEVSIAQMDREVYDQAWHIWSRVGSAGLVTLVWVSLIPLVGNQAIAGNPKYWFVYWLAIAISNYGSTSFRNADLTDADFSNANLRQADFRDANLTRTRWHHAKYLAQARTDEEYLENPKIRQLVISLSGKGQNFDHFDLRGLNLAGADLTKASFEGTKLSGATLKGAKLDGAKLVRTQLYGTDLSEASLTGAYIQGWSISTDIKLFDDVQCRYVYMQLPTEADPDPCRKPDNKKEFFEQGDFADFITPIITTLELYQTRDVDPRQFKTLDLFHHGRVDPAVATVALAEFISSHSEADIKVVALEGHGDDKVRVQVKVNGKADRSALSADYAAIYQEVSLRPRADLQASLDNIKDESILNFANAIQTATKSNMCFITINQTIVNENNSINIDSGGGNVSGVVGGNVKNVNGTVNLGTVHSDVNNAIGQQQ